MTFEGRRSTGSRRGLGGEAIGAGNGMKHGVDVSRATLSEVSSPALSTCAVCFEATCVFACSFTNTSTITSEQCNNGNSSHEHIDIQNM